MKLYATTSRGATESSSQVARKGSNKELITTLAIGNKKIGRVAMSHDKYTNTTTIYYYPIGQGGRTLLHEQKCEKQKGTRPHTMGICTNKDCTLTNTHTLNHCM